MIRKYYELMIYWQRITSSKIKGKPQIINADEAIGVMSGKITPDLNQSPEISLAIQNNDV